MKNLLKISGGSAVAAIGLQWTILSMLKEYCIVFYNKYIAASVIPMPYLIMVHTLVFFLFAALLYSWNFHQKKEKNLTVNLEDFEKQNKEVEIQLISVREELKLKEKEVERFEKTEHELIKYKNQNEAKDDILKDIEESNTIRIYTMRGHSFILPDRAFGKLPNNKDKTIKFCVADPQSTMDSNPSLPNNLCSFSSKSSPKA